MPPFVFRFPQLPENFSSTVLRRYVFTRKLNFLKQSDALVAFPGGFGTMDEIFEAITLIQTGKCTIFPVVLMDPPGESFWQRWIRFIEKELLEAHLIARTSALSWQYTGSHSLPYLSSRMFWKRHCVMQAMM